MKPNQLCNFVLPIVLLIIACKPEHSSVLERNYFPLATGLVFEYQITETRYAINQPAVSSVYRLREVVGETYPDNSLTAIFPIIRSKKRGTDRWETDSIIPAWITADKAIRIENGHTIVKLRLPAEFAQRWDGHEYTTLGEQVFESRSVGQPFSTDFADFENTVTVLQQNDSTLVSLKRSLEVFADQIGLVYKERTSLFYCNTNDCVGEGKILYGKKEIMQLVHSNKL